MKWRKGVRNLSSLVKGYLWCKTTHSDVLGLLGAGFMFFWLTFTSIWVRWIQLVQYFFSNWWLNQYTYLHRRNLNTDTKTDGPWKMYLGPSTMASFQVSTSNFRWIVYVYQYRVARIHSYALWNVVFDTGMLLSPSVRVSEKKPPSANSWFKKRLHVTRMCYDFYFKLGRCFYTWTCFILVTVCFFNMRFINSLGFSFGTS